MDKVQAGRLLTLAYFLKTKVDPEQFDMERFGCSLHSELDMSDPPCGSSACALGWATVIWPDRMRLVKAAGMLKTFDLYVDDHMTGYNNRRIQEFFGISEANAEFLFSAMYERTPKEEAKLIERVVRRHGWVYNAA